MFVEFNLRSINMHNFMHIYKTQNNTHTLIAFARRGRYGSNEYPDETSIDHIFDILDATNVFPCVKFKGRILNANHIRHLKLNNTTLAYFLDTVEVQSGAFPNSTKEDKRELQRLLNEAMRYKPELCQIIATPKTQTKTLG